MEIKAMEKYMEGMVRGAEVWGAVCSVRDCDSCAIGIARGDEIECAEFARQFPKKFISLLLDEANCGISYAQEFVSRFPANGMSAEDLVDLGMCRKAIFEGDISCDEYDSEESCLSCWRERFFDDIEEDEEDEEEDEDEEEPDVIEQSDFDYY